MRAQACCSDATVTAFTAGGLAGNNGGQKCTGSKASWPWDSLEKWLLKNDYVRQLLLGATDSMEKDDRLRIMNR